MSLAIDHQIHIASRFILFSAWHSKNRVPQSFTELHRAPHSPTELQRGPQSRTALHRAPQSSTEHRRAVQSVTNYYFNTISNISEARCQNCFQDASQNSFWTFLMSDDKIAPGSPLEAHFAHFWSQVAKWLPGDLN